MNKQDKTPQLPLAGGDYVDKGAGLKQVAPSTAPAPGKSEAATPRRAPAATEADTATPPSRAPAGKTP